MTPRLALVRWIVVFTSLLTQPAAAADDAGWKALKRGAVVLFRHATAPGVGDPPGFRLGDCTTQRNLDASGRAEAARLGATFRAHGIRVGAVLSSQWCRARETADLAFPLQAKPEPIFDSFFDDAARHPAQTAAARVLISAWQGPGALVVVTHQVNITALTNVVLSSGEGVVVQPDVDRLRVVARLSPTR